MSRLPATSGEGQVKVLKFGGSSFLDLTDYTVVAKYVTSMLTSADTRVLAVVSGMSGSTGRLLEAALSIDPGLHPQVQDQVLATAEMVSASFMRAALNAVGCPATDLWAPQSGILSDSAATQARIVRFDPRPVIDAFAEHRVVVVAGGQAMDADNRITMLGRNSSDLTAVVFADGLSVGRCDIFGDTPGIFTADPHVVPSARLQSQVTYRQCVAMSESGAKVLHWGAARYAERHGVVVRCRQLDDVLAGHAAAGTLVGVGNGRTAVVGDTRVRLYRPSPSVDIDVAVAALREANLVAKAVHHNGVALLAFPAGQLPERTLVELDIAGEPVEGLGMVSVVEPDGTVTRRLVGRDEVDSAVAAEHERIHGAPDTEVPVFVRTKRRSPHSGLLLGVQAADSDSPADSGRG